MRAMTHSVMLGILALCATLSSVSALRAEEYSSVPTAIEQIDDTVLRDAMVQYSPNYNYLGRAEQVTAYVNLYQALRGAQPALTAADAVYLARGPEPVYVVPETQTYYVSPSPTYYYPSGPGFSFGFSYGRDRWHRPGWHGPRPGHRPPHFGNGPGRPRPPGGHPGGPGGGRPPRPRPR